MFEAHQTSRMMRCCSLSRLSSVGQRYLNTRLDAVTGAIMRTCESVLLLLGSGKHVSTGIFGLTRRAWRGIGSSSSGGKKRKRKKRRKKRLPRNPPLQGRRRPCDLQRQVPVVQGVRVDSASASFSSSTTVLKTAVVPQLQFIACRRLPFRAAEADPHGPDCSADHRDSPVAVRCQVVDVPIGDVTVQKTIRSCSSSRLSTFLS